MDGKVIQAGKFDNKSTNEERDALLRTLLDTAEAAENIGDDDEMDDDELNDIMARSEEEIPVFQEIDRQRLATDTYGPGHRYPRLMCEQELPEIYMQEDNPVTEEIEIEVTGRGARERKITKYDDGLTEEQWLMAVDADDDTIEEAIARKEARVERRKSNKTGRDGEDSSPEPSIIDDDDTPQKQKRRRGPPPKRKAEEVIEETPQPKRKRGRQPKVPDTLNPTDRANLNRILETVIQSLIDMEAEVPPEGSDSEEGPMIRAIIDPFMKPPPRSYYPDYYMIIQNPIAIDNIQKKIKRSDYQNLRSFRNDIHLLCQNARTYNEDGSLLFQDANDIENKALSELRRLTEAHPELGGFEDQSTGGDGSTGLGSGADTPVPGGTPGQPKLKLTFNNPNRDSPSTSNGAEFGFDQ
ncbi:unnamed protein product [Penicillium salamii]|uniref:Bromo domain-containing protein n=1 Tax=Penicillium salamii TaxID=1612424 RepID=A0A9W4IBM2_9EURO|nr:unnamed protein product [Penicillium salamii]CAG8252495.1 unnamed protein product [Penicillium salamii]CAG8265720.1 unnamed protein product [Penicillium salamii]CAG8341837.1 unnamed protein product [Penicillium salamii]CAG8376802.1 unnamed protein product [Penicillium salamii]